jgi:hypothetical protein
MANRIAARTRRGIRRRPVEGDRRRAVAETDHYREVAAVETVPTFARRQDVRREVQRVAGALSRHRIQDHPVLAGQLVEPVVFGVASSLPPLIRGPLRVRRGGIGAESRAERGEAGAEPREKRAARKRQGNVGAMH